MNRAFLLLGVCLTQGSSWSLSESAEYAYESVAEWIAVREDLRSTRLERFLSVNPKSRMPIKVEVVEEALGAFKELGPAEGSKLLQTEFARRKVEEARSQIILFRGRLADPEKIVRSPSAETILHRVFRRFGKRCWRLLQIRWRLLLTR